MDASKVLADKTRPTNYDELPLFLSVPETATALGIGRNTTYNMIRSGKLKGIRVGHKIRIPKAALQRLVPTNDFYEEDI